MRRIASLITVLLFSAELFAAETSLRFYGSGAQAPLQDRVQITVDEPETPADIGSTDFTIEFWMKGLKSENPAGGGGSVECDGNNYSWIYGRIIIDRDRFDTAEVADGRDFGASLITRTGQIAFGIANSSNSAYTVCSSGINLLDGKWHHVALQRRLNGEITIFVDGSQVGSGQGSAGDISFPNGAAVSGRAAERSLVLGAEKHDIDLIYPSFSGWMDELRLSKKIRYTAKFTPVRTPFELDADTAALFHFNAEEEGECRGQIADERGLSPGECQFGGNGARKGPRFSLDSPFKKVAPRLVPGLAVRVKKNSGGVLLIRGRTKSPGRISIVSDKKVIRQIRPVRGGFVTRIRAGKMVIIRQAPSGQYSGASLKVRI